jgi:hypothetical protein
MSSADTHPENAWQARSNELAEWTWRHLVNRTDVWGCYVRARDGKKSRGLTAPPKKSRGRLLLTQAVLAVHFQGIRELCGVHSTSPENTCRWVVLDIDKHKEDDGADPVENERAAKALHADLTTLGIRCLLLDSNGKGGFHLWIVFSGPVSAADAYAFGQRLARDLRDKHGLKQEIEAFPKQARIERYGNYVRLPGLHHSREYLTRIWNGSEWLGGEAAVNTLLAYKPNPPTIVPSAASPAPEIEEEPQTSVVRSLTAVSAIPNASEKSPCNVWSSSPITPNRMESGFASWPLLTTRAWASTISSTGALGAASMMRPNAGPTGDISMLAASKSPPSEP